MFEQTFYEIERDTWSQKAGRYCEIFSPFELCHPLHLADSDQIPEACFFRPERRGLVEETSILFLIRYPVGDSMN